jgi:hypothetical protein
MPENFFGFGATRFGAPMENFRVKVRALLHSVSGFNDQLVPPLS